MLLKLAQLMSVCVSSSVTLQIKFAPFQLRFSTTFLVLDAGFSTSKTEAACCVSWDGPTSGKNLDPPPKEAFSGPLFVCGLLHSHIVFSPC